jgi:hypothetical protein
MKEKKDRIPLGLKPEQQTHIEFNDLMDANQPRPTKEAMFAHLVHQAWLQLQKDRQIGSEPEVKQ